LSRLLGLKLLAVAGGVLPDIGIVPHERHEVAVYQMARVTTEADQIGPVQLAGRVNVYGNAMVNLNVLPPAAGGTGRLGG